MGPLVSVIMANYRGAPYLAASVRSVLAQTHQNLELIIADDHSPDDSARLATALAASDARIKVLLTDRNQGPGAARNRALDAARGDWVAIVDSDDLLHPSRFSRLLAAADRLGADMIADDMVFFGAVPGAGGKTLLQPMALCAPLKVGPALFLRASGEDPAVPALGYLKPMIRRAVLGQARYDTALRIGEDYDLYLRLLLHGARFSVLADPMYLYRRHAASISHRLSVDTVQAMRRAHQALAPLAVSPADLAAAYAGRGIGLDRLLRFETLVQALKSRDFSAAARLIARHPGLVVNLSRSLAERLGRTRAVAAPRLPLRLALDVPPLPEPGAAWTTPPAEHAARLSQLAASHDLAVIASDAGGEWFSALVPEHRALFPAASGDGHSGGGGQKT